MFDGPLDEGPGVALWVNDPDEANTPRFVERWSCVDVHLGQAAVVRVRVVNPDTSPADAARVGIGFYVAVLEQEHHRSGEQFGVRHDTVGTDLSTRFHEPEAPDEPVTYGSDVLIDEVEGKSLRRVWRGHPTGSPKEQPAHSKTAMAQRLGNRQRAVPRVSPTPRIGVTVIAIATRKTRYPLDLP